MIILHILVEKMRRTLENRAASQFHTRNMHFEENNYIKKIS